MKTKEKRLSKLLQVFVSAPHTMELVERKELDGWQKIFSFENGFGASVVDHKISYGLEFALLDENGGIVEHPEITDNVEGYINISEANNLLEKIAKLPKKV